MYKWKKLLVSLLTVSVISSAASIMNVKAADESYTYKITLSAGNKGTINGQSKVETTNIASGSTVSFYLNDIQVTDDKYYVKGIRLSGRDNDEALASPAFEVTGDADYVVAYGIKGDMVAYTINYQDVNGNALAESQTFYGNVGDKPVVAYRYIENYVPQALALTKTLVDNEAENIFTFTYTPGSSDRVVETTTTTTVTTVVSGTTNNSGNSTSGSNQTGTSTSGTSDANQSTVNSDSSSTQNPSQDNNSQNNTVTSEDEETPKDLVDLDDGETPKANIKLKESSKRTPLAVGIGVIVVAVAALIALIVFLRKRAK